MRWRSRPISAKASGSTFSASQVPPGRNGASHSSQATPSTIRPATLPTASARVHSTTGGRGAAGKAGGTAEGAGGAVIAGYDAIDESPDHRRSPCPEADMAGAVVAPVADAADLAVARDADHAAPALPRRPPGPDGQQPDLHDADLSGAAGHRDAGGVHRVPDVLELPGRTAEILPAEPGARCDREAGAGRADAVREQGEPARHLRPGGAGVHRARIDADDRPHAE